MLNINFCLLFTVVTLCNFLSAMEDEDGSETIEVDENQNSNNPADEIQNIIYNCPNKGYIKIISDSRNKKLKISNNNRLPQRKITQEMPCKCETVKTKTQKIAFHDFSKGSLKIYKGGMEIIKSNHKKKKPRSSHLTRQILMCKKKITPTIIINRETGSVKKEIAPFEENTKVLGEIESEDHVELFIIDRL